VKEKQMLCIPVIEDQGLESRVSAHFGSAPIFMLIDPQSGERRALLNRNQNHARSTCSPLASLAGQPIDCVAVGGIGMGALMKLEDAGIEVFHSTCGTVGETLEAFKSGSLKKMDPRFTCAGHDASAQACSHH
jgi:predicted Fe-Mo cluster-binding NifX family protein